MRFAEEVRHGETYVKRWIAKMAHFEIEQHQPAAVDEDVFWAEVAMYKANFMPKRLLHEGVEKRSRIKDARSRIKVVRLESQASKIGIVLKSTIRFRRRCRIPVYCCQDRAELLK